MADEALPPNSGTSRWRGLALPVGVLGAALVLYHQRYLTFLASDQQVVGTDYSYFLPHLLAGDYWFAANGPFAVPWMTPAFCGGLPFYANPQSFYYSPAQWFSFVVDPLTAVRWSILLFAAAGGFGMYALMRKSFETSPPVALLAGLIFLFNGFFSHRMVIGHFAFSSFMLVPLVALLIIGDRTRAQWLARGLGAGLLIAVMFQSGLVVLFGPAGMAVVFIAVLAAIRSGGGMPMLKASAVSLVAAAALSLAKVVSAAAFVSQFGRDFYPLPGADRVGDLLAVTFQMLFSRPVLEIEKVFRHGRIRMRLHEWEYGISPIPAILIAFGIGLLVMRRLRTPREGAARPFDMRLAILGLLLMIPLLLNYYSPGWNSFLRHLPVIGSMQTLSRWLAFYIPVLAVLTALAADLLPAGGKAPMVFVAACAVIAFHMTEDFTETGHLPQRWYEATLVQDAWQELHKTGSVKPITHNAVLRNRALQVDMINGENALARGASSLQCYEPIFGYTLQKFPVQSLHEGLSTDIVDGDLNVKNPACFVYPQENECRPGAQFPVSRKDEAEAFLSYKPLAWKVSSRQQVANLINLLALLAVPGLMIWSWRRRS